MDAGGQRYLEMTKKKNSLHDTPKPHVTGILLDYGPIVLRFTTTKSKTVDSWHATAIKNYRVEAVGVSIATYMYSERIAILWICDGAISWYFVNDCLIQVRI